MPGRETNLCICVLRTNKSRVFPGTTTHNVSSLGTQSKLRSPLRVEKSLADNQNSIAYLLVTSYISQQACTIPISMPLRNVNIKQEY